MRRFLRNLLLLLLIVAIFAAVGFYIYDGNRLKTEQLYNERVTLQVETAVYAALYNATRTLEADLRHYRLIEVTSSESLLDVALRYDTTIEVLRMANNLLPIVDYGDGSKLIVPEGVKILNPPRRLVAYTAVEGDTLPQLSGRFDVGLDILQLDNPILARRGIIPGDIVFIPELL